MSLAWYVVLDREVPNLDPFMNGKALARSAPAIASMAARLGVRDLGDFISTSPAEIADLVEDEIADELPAESWYSPEEGLRVVRAMVTEVAKSSRMGDVLTDLRELERVLDRAQQVGARWHLAVDF